MHPCWSCCGMLSASMLVMLWDVAYAKEQQTCVYCIFPDAISPFKLLSTSDAPAVETVRRSHPRDLAAITLNKHGHKTFPLTIILYPGYNKQDFPACHGVG